MLERILRGRMDEAGVTCGEMEPVSRVGAGVENDAGAADLVRF